jgi:uncharacterized protein (DUF1501 family)
MMHRRQFLARTLAGTSLLAVGSVVPQFIANTARAAEPGKENILVIIEMNGGNDGLNTVIPYTDDLYYKYRPTLGIKKEQLVKVDDNVGLNPGMRSLQTMIKDGNLAVVQGVGYPNPDRSHFEAMDIWQSADPKRQIKSGWVGRSVTDLQDKKGNVPVMQLGASRLPLALQGAPGGVVSINNNQPYKLDLGTKDPQRVKVRRELMTDLAKPGDDGGAESLLQFVQRRELQTYTTLDKIQTVLQNNPNPNGGVFVQGDPMQGGQFYQQGTLPQRMDLIARLILQDFGTRVYYLMIDGFDTHSSQADAHMNLLRTVADGITHLFTTLSAAKSGHDKRTLVMTFSEFGRRVQENGSKGTDHGSGSCLFVAGPAVKGGAVGKHPSLKREDLDYETSIVDRQSGDIKFHTDFRKLYATLLDKWMGVDSNAVLSGKFEHIELLKG